MQTMKKLFLFALLGIAGCSKQLNSFVLPEGTVLPTGSMLGVEITKVSNMAQFKLLTIGNVQPQNCNVVADYRLLPELHRANVKAIALRCDGAIVELEGVVVDGNGIDGVKLAEDTGEVVPDSYQLLLVKAIDISGLTLQSYQTELKWRNK